MQHVTAKTKTAWWLLPSLLQFIYRYTPQSRVNVRVKTDRMINQAGCAEINCPRLGYKLPHFLDLGTARARVNGTGTVLEDSS